MNEDAKIQLRLPVEIRAWLKGFAAGQSRSMNGQIIELIKEKREAEKGKAPTGMLGS